MKHFLSSLSVLLVLTLSSLSFAQPATNQNDVQKYIQMHENMIKINQDAITCLKSGKAIDDCGNQFHQTMRELMMNNRMMGYCCPMMRDHMNGNMNGHMMPGQMHNDM